MTRIAAAQKMFGQLDASLSTLLQAMKMYPDRAVVHLHHALLCAKELKLWPDAVWFAQQALDLDPSLPQACFVLAE